MMNRKLASISLGLALVVTSQTALAAGTAGEQTTPTVNMPMGGTAQAANNAGKSQDGAKAASLAMAAMMAAMCGPQNPAACVMAALALAQASSLGGTAEGARNVAAMQSTSSTAFDDVKTGNPGGGAAIGDVRKQLQDKGMKISNDMKSLEMPDGKTVPLNAFAGTDAGMKASGFSDAQIAAGKTALADAQQKLVGAMKRPKDSEMNMPGAGGGGGGASAGGGGVVFKMPGTRNAPKLSGLSKNLGNDKIGVAADNIFEMISRRYQQKDAANTFVGQ